MKKTNVITPMWHNCQSILKSGDLDVFNESAGTLTDVVERKNEIKLNLYKSNSPYTTPSA